MSSSAMVRAAFICVRMRAWPRGTTGKEAGDVDAFVKELRRHILRERVSQHDRDDRMLSRQQIKAELRQMGLPVRRVLEKAAAQIVAFFDEPDGFQPRRNNRRREGFENKHGRARCARGL